MSEDMVDLLHAAEDTIGELQEQMIRMIVAVNIDDHEVHSGGDFGHVFDRAAEMVQPKWYCRMSCQDDCTEDEDECGCPCHGVDDDAEDPIVAAMRASGYDENGEPLEDEPDDGRIEAAAEAMVWAEVEGPEPYEPSPYDGTYSET